MGELVGVDEGTERRQGRRHCNIAAEYDFINMRKMQTCLIAPRAADRQRILGGNEISRINREWRYGKHGKVTIQIKI